METDNKKTPLDRLAYSGDLGPVVDRLSEAYGVGRPKDFSVIGVGYEDCNVKIETPYGRYVAKIFSKSRSKEEINRYGSIMERVVEAGVNHPPLMRANDGAVIYMDAQANGISMVLMQFVDGKTFLELGRTPDSNELGEIVEQAVKVNGIDYRPPNLFDSWAIPNISQMFAKVQKFMQRDDMDLVIKVIGAYDKIPVSKLPHCFVHGDFTKANVLISAGNEAYILDFSVANWYPRIQELAVMAANLTHEEDVYKPLDERCETVYGEYNRLSPLTQVERKYLYPYSLAGAAMEFMGAHMEKYIKGNDTEETTFWLDLGRTSLQKELD